MSVVSWTAIFGNHYKQDNSQQKQDCFELVYRNGVQNKEANAKRSKGNCQCFDQMVGDLFRVSDTTRTYEDNYTLYFNAAYIHLRAFM